VSKSLKKQQKLPSPENIFSGTQILERNCVTF